MKKIQNTRWTLFFAGLVLLLILGRLAVDATKIAATADPENPDFIGKFNGERALADVKYQVSLGARTPGSDAHGKTEKWIVRELQQANWSVEIQDAPSQSHSIRNIVARWGEGRPWIVVGAHYDSRFVADRDPDPSMRSLPVPGANDGASGVSVLLEMARNLPERMAPGENPGKPCWGQVWLVFFDAEDQGNLPGWDWILGSRAFVTGLEEFPDAVVIVDMIGDADLNIYLEKNSDAELSRQIWSSAALLGFSGFVAQPRHQMTDDHIPFVEAGIPAVDLIDFDYPYWHTTQDTPDKVSAESLRAVGETLLTWLSSCSMEQ
jgi:glutaminyl-peptide cyclotransferase